MSFAHSGRREFGSGVRILNTATSKVKAMATRLPYLVVNSVLFHSSFYQLDTSHSILSAYNP